MLISVLNHFFFYIYNWHYWKILDNYFTQLSNHQHKICKCLRHNLVFACLKLLKLIFTKFRGKYVPTNICYVIYINTNYLQLDFPWGRLVKIMPLLFQIVLMIYFPILYLQKKKRVCCILKILYMIQLNIWVGK